MARSSPIAWNELVRSGCLLQRLLAAPLPPELANGEAAIRATEQFRTVYEPLGAQFVCVTIENLVTPQWWVDTDQVDELVREVPAEDDLDGLFDFCFAPGSIGHPLTLGMNGAVVTSRKCGLGMISPIRIAFACESPWVSWRLGGLDLRGDDASR